MESKYTKSEHNLRFLAHSIPTDLTSTLGEFGLP